MKTLFSIRGNKELKCEECGTNLDLVQINGCTYGTRAFFGYFFCIKCKIKYHAEFSQQRKHCYELKLLDRRVL